MKKNTKGSTKFVFITGGVVSSLGKGLVAASLGLLLKSRGLKVTIQKLDPYLNIDPGTMSPYQHGEVFVTEDGAETDLDLGHYERFIDTNLSKLNNTTSGQVYLRVIQNERDGKYLGGTVQVIPHITDEIKRSVRAVAKQSKANVVISEVGGTVGDIESLPFLEALRQLRLEEESGNTLFIHLTLVPYLPTSGELKTKPTQHSVRALRDIGIQPEIIICRTSYPLGEKLKEKIALFCNVSKSHVIEDLDTEYIYDLPLHFFVQRLDVKVASLLKMKPLRAHLKEWKKTVKSIKYPKNGVVKIGLCGKYIQLKDSYKSIIEGLTHAGAENNVRVNIQWIDAEHVEKSDVKMFSADVDGLLVAPGFGKRGAMGKIKTIQYARERKIPFLGICLGLQLAIIEFARNVCGIKNATSTEFAPHTSAPIISLMEDQKRKKNLGGTMRLGAFTCSVKTNTKTFEAYGKRIIQERHRHRWEVNNHYRDILSKHGMIFSGINPETDLVEIIEIKDHPWFVATQFHPEYKSRITHAAPLFRAFVLAAIVHRER